MTGNLTNRSALIAVLIIAVVIISCSFLVSFRSNGRRAGNQNGRPPKSRPADLAPIKQDKPLDAQGVADLAFQSVVYIESLTSAEGGMQGSGFYIRPNLVVTNHHVINGAVRIEIHGIGDSEATENVRVVSSDPQLDIALLEVGDIQKRPLVLADPGSIKTGQKIYALGNPVGLEGTISEGLISSSNLRELEGVKWLQVSCPISPGNSGGPIVDHFGRVVGVATKGSKIAILQNLNFAVPGRTVSEFITQFDREHQDK